MEKHQLRENSGTEAAGTLLGNATENEILILEEKSSYQSTILSKEKE